MSKSPEEYLNHILDELNYLSDSSKNVSQEQFMHDMTLQRAFSRSLEIIGEAAKNLPQDFTKNRKEVEWKSIAGLRDRLIHQYFGVDYEIVWDVLRNEVPKLKIQIARLLKATQ